MLSRFLQNELLPYILPSNYLPWYLSAVSSSVKCLYISIAFHRLCYPLLITLRIILIHLKRLFLLKTIRHYHTYHEVLDFTYRPIGLYLVFLRFCISFLFVILYYNIVLYLSIVICKYFNYFYIIRLFLCFRTN